MRPSAPLDLTVDLHAEPARDATRTDVVGNDQRAHAVETQVGRVCALIEAGNVRSRRVANKLGMEIDRKVEWGGRPHDLWMLDLG